MPASTAPASPDATSLDHCAESATTALYRAAIGAVNADYYLPIFTRFEAANRVSPSWNWAASLYTLNWLLFRQLWLAAGVYGGAVLGTALVWFLFPDALEPSLLLVLGGLSVLVPGFYGNALWHRACRQKMAQALSSHPSLVLACAGLNQQASSRQGFIRLALFNAVLLCAAVAAYLLWPVAGKTPPVRPQAAAQVRQLAAGRVTDLAPVPAPVASAVVAPPTDAASASAVVAPPVLAASEPVPAPAPVLVPASPASVPVLASVKESVKVAPVSERLAPKPAAAAAVPAEASHHFAINVGLFAKEANAQKVHAQLKAAKLPVYTQALHTSKGKLTRVRVGPFKSQQAAQAAAEKIHALKLEAVVFEP